MGSIDPQRTPVDGMVPAEEETRACDVSPGSSSLHSPEPAVLARCPRCPSCRMMRAAGACGAAKRATTYAWGKQPHTEPNPALAGDSATSAEPSPRVARTSADATAVARPECRRPSWTFRGHPRETSTPLQASVRFPIACRRHASRFVHRRSELRERTRAPFRCLPTGVPSAPWLRRRGCLIPDTP